jgi:serine/threonine-protein kinase
LSSKPTENPEAYDYYLRGREFFNRGLDESNVRQAIASYEKAVALDPEFATAEAALSETHSEMYWFFFDRSPERLAKARAAADEALKIRPNLSECHRALGYYYYWGHLDYDNALREFDLALRGQPNNSDVLFAIGAVRRRQGRWEEAIANFRKAADLDPRSGINFYNLGETYYLVRDYASARRYVDRSVILAPDWNAPPIEQAVLLLSEKGDLDGARRVLRDAAKTTGMENLAPEFTGPYGRINSFLITSDTAQWALLQSLSAITFKRDSGGYFLLKGDLFREQNQGRVAASYYDSARVVLEARVRELPEEDLFHIRLGVAYARLGRYPEAIRESTKATQLLPLSREAYRGALNLVDLALVYTLAGDQEKAIDILRQLLAVPSCMSVPRLRVDLAWTALRGNPKFEALLASGSRSQ